MKILNIISILIVLSFSLHLNSQCFSNDHVEYGSLKKKSKNYAANNFFKNESLKMRNSFGVAAFIFFSDYSTSNAYAVDKSNDRSRGIYVHGDIIFTESMVEELMRDNGVYSLIVVFAHEMAHVLQYKYNFPFDNFLNKEGELFADFLAGAYTTKKFIDDPDFYGASWNQMVNNSYLSNGVIKNYGDDNYGSPDHHGTDGERQSAFNLGFFSAVHYSRTRGKMPSMYQFYRIGLHLLELGVFRYKNYELSHEQLIKIIKKY